MKKLILVAVLMILTVSAIFADKVSFIGRFSSLNEVEKFVVRDFEFTKIWWDDYEVVEKLTKAEWSSAKRMLEKEYDIKDHDFYCVWLTKLD